MWRRLLAEFTGSALLVSVVVGSGIAGQQLSPTDIGLTGCSAAVGVYIGAAYWYTSSTSFANPAITVGRVISDTFAGIAPGSVAGFIAAQVVGALIGVALVVALYPDAKTAYEVVVPHPTVSRPTQN